MKKWMAMIVTMMLLATVAVSSAAVPSISTGDTTQATGYTASTGVTIADGFVLEPTETPEMVQNEILNMFNFVNGTDPKQAPADYFTDEVQQMITEKLPETVGLDALEANEIIALHIANYDTAYGDVTVDFTFATMYEVGKAVVVLIGLIDAEGNIEWVALDAVAKEDGSLAVTFTEAVCLQMEEAAEIMMVVLNEQ